MQKLTSDPKVADKFVNYPDFVKPQMEALRLLVIECAEPIETILKIDECLKWGEPSFVTKFGSTIRMDWKAKSPNQYALYFKCTSRLVETFRAVFGDLFQYEKNRAIIFQLDDQIPTEELKVCITAALTYHKVKHLELLGI